MKLYVGNLPDDTEEAQLTAWFAEFGVVDAVNLMCDYRTGEFRQYAFVEMSDDTEARAAIKALDGSVKKERPIKVAEAFIRKVLSEYN